MVSVHWEPPDATGLETSTTGDFSPVEISPVDDWWIRPVKNSKNQGLGESQDRRVTRERTAEREQHRGV